MKLFTRIKVSYFAVCFVPLLLIMIAVFAITAAGVNFLEKQYDAGGAGLDTLYNPTKLLGKMTKTIITELEETMVDDTEKLRDINYLTELNAKLSDQSSYLVVKINDTFYFHGDIAEGLTPVADHCFTMEGDASFFALEESTSHIWQRVVQFANGNSGTVFIVTNIHMMMPRVRLALMQMVAVVICIFLITGTTLTVWLYKSIVKPIGQLKIAAESIKDGNLNFSIQPEADDEIGELCVAFEEMRVQLKTQIDISMQYETESKELISNISHDLKTPITAIKGYIEGIMDGVADSPEKMDKYIRTIYTKANDMQKMIEELFLYAKLDSNSVTYSFAKVNLNDYFIDCIEEISVDLEAKKIDLGFFNYADKEVVIIADPEQLKRVIMNIVGNSAKYIGDKKGIINIRIHEEPEFVQVEIEDNGKGIAQKELPHIFDRCYRTDASRNSAQGGSGLGLSIAKKIIDEHGGRIWATSRENIGTSICFVLRKYEERKLYE